MPQELLYLQILISKGQQADKLTLSFSHR